MAPPNPFWVQRYLRDYNIDALLADAVNQAVGQRSTDPAASLAQYFTLLSKRNGEIAKISARRVLNSNLKLAVELRVECFFNGGTRVACTTMGEPVELAAPAAAEGEDGAAPAEDADETPDAKRARLVDANIECLNKVVGPAMEGIFARATREVDEAVKTLPAAISILTSLALAEAGSAMQDLPLYLFVAKAVDELLQQGDIALGGGHLVAVPSADDLVLEDEKPAPAVTDAEPAGGAEGAEGEEQEGGAVAANGQPVKLPVVLLPAFACGPDVDPKSKVRMGKFWLMTKRDGPLRETIPDIISVYNQLREQMQSKADARKAEGSEGEQQQAEVGAPAAGGAIADEEGFFFAPEAESVGEVLGYMEAAATAAGKAWGDDVTVCCNMGAHAYFLPNTLEVGTYCYKPEGEEEGAPAIEADGWADWVCAFLDANPAVAAIEDVAANEDYETWRKVRLAVEGREQQVVVLGDAIYRDDADLYRSGVAEGWAAGAVMRPAVLGTLTELLDNATMFTTIKPKALRLVLAHRAGERAGEAEADVAVGIGAWGIKCAAPSHATVRKLSRLICIEEELDKMKQAAEEGNAEAQLAHLVSWQQVYEEEEAAAAAYAAAAEEAAQGP